jgi:high-affinity iron transporter
VFLAAVFVAIPVVVAAVVIAALPSSKSSATTVTITNASCAPKFDGLRTGPQTFTVQNRTTKAGEINLVNASGAVVAEIETIGPGTSAQMSATLSSGAYTFRCLMAGRPATTSASVVASGGGSDAAAPAAVVPVTVQQLTAPNQRYQAYAAADLATLGRQVAAISADLRRADLAAARVDWLAAQLTWERVGASYNSFGAAGVAIDGLPDGLPGGVHDPGFTGLHRLEYGLWHGQSAAQLGAVTDRLARDVAELRRTLRSAEVTGDPTNLPLRAHEILEDALRDHLSGIDDQGGGAAYGETYADSQVTRVVLGDLTGLITARAPKLVPTGDAQLDTLQHALLATRAGGHWRSIEATPLRARQQVEAAIGELLETLSAVPTLLEIPPTH